MAKVLVLAMFCSTTLIPSKYGLFYCLDKNDIIMVNIGQYSIDLYSTESKLTKSYGYDYCPYWGFKSYRPTDNLRIIDSSEKNYKYLFLNDKEYVIKKVDPKDLKVIVFMMGMKGLKKSLALSFVANNDTEVYREPRYSKEW